MNERVDLNAGRPTIAVPNGRLLIGGAWVDAKIAVIDPATEDVINEIAAATATDVNKAVNAAQAAFDSRWRRLRLLDRGRLLERLSLLIERRAEELALLETLDNGKP